MEGVMSLPDFLLPQVKSPTSQSSNKASDDKVSFGNLFEKWFQDESQGISGMPLLDDQKIMWEALEQLINFRLLLVKDLSGECVEQELEVLLKKMMGDSGFFASLPNHLKDLLQQLKGKDVKQISQLLVDLPVKDELVESWYDFQKEKEIELLFEVNELILAIQKFLQQSEITGETKASKLISGEQKALDVSQFADGLQAKIDQFMAQKRGEVATNDLTAGQRLLATPSPKLQKKNSQPLLSRVAAFLTKAETTAEKLGCQDSFVDLKSGLYNYLTKNTQNKFQLSANNHYLALRLQTRTAGDFAEKVFHDPSTEHQVSDAKHSSTNYDVLANADFTKTDLATGENAVEKTSELISKPAEQVFQQIVESFKLDVKQGVSQMQMRLYPEELGSLLLKLTLEEGLVTARFVTETVHVKEMIEENLPHLRESMIAEGIFWDKISVDVGQDGLTENPFAYQGQEQFQEKESNHYGQERSFDGELTAEELIKEESLVKDSNKLVDYLA